MDEVDKTLKKVLSFTIEERIKYEKSKGYRSYGSVCEELYLSINPEDFETVDALKAFVSDHADYLQLIKDENGELNLETRLYQSPHVYLINKDHMYQINDKVFKVFENGNAVTNKEYSSMLKEMDELTIKNLEKNEIIDYIPIKEEQSLKSISETCNYRFDGSTVNGNNKLDFKLYLGWQHDMYGTTNTYVHSDIYVRPKYKVGFIWYWAKRTISHYADLDYSCSQNRSLNQVWRRQEYNYGGWITPNGPIPLVEGQKATQISYGKVYSFADTPDVPRVYFICDGNPYFN